MIAVDEPESDVREPSARDRLAVLRVESRAVLDHQVDLVRSIDEKAMWLVRTAVVATSVVLTGAGIAGESFLARNWAVTAFATLGVGALLFMSAWGSVLCAVSRPPFGPSRELTRQLSDRQVESGTTYHVLLNAYEEWIADAREEAAGNALAFTWLQLAFVAAVFWLTVSAALLALSTTVVGDQATLALLGATTTLGLVLSVWRTNLGVEP